MVRLCFRPVVSGGAGEPSGETSSPPPAVATGCAACGRFLTTNLPLPAGAVALKARAGKGTKPRASIIISESCSTSCAGRRPRSADHCPHPCERSPFAGQDCRAIYSLQHRPTSHFLLYYFSLQKNGRTPPLGAEYGRRALRRRSGRQSTSGFETQPRKPRRRTTSACAPPDS